LAVTSSFYGILFVATIVLVTHPTTGGSTNTVALVLPKLQIVWRNPQPIRSRRRWEPFQEPSSSRLYIVQEFLSTGEHGFWCAISNLEVISRQSFNPVARNRRLSVG
jgi:hypothetical protein